MKYFTIFSVMAPVWGMVGIVFALSYILILISGFLFSLILILPIFPLGNFPGGALSGPASLLRRPVCKEGHI
jgi:hypothetical protein